MSRKKILIEEDSPFIGIEITYPFCYKTKEKKYEGISYYRYLEDGRYEHICIQDLQMQFSYGNHSNTIYSLVGDHEFYFKQIAVQHEIISSHEFEEKRDEYFSKYKDYLEGAKYIASEVEEMIKNAPNSQRKETLIENDIIINKDDTPF